MKIIDFEVITLSKSLEALEDWLEIFKTIQIVGEEEPETGDIVFRVSQLDLVKLTDTQVNRLIVAVRLAKIEALREVKTV